MDYLAKVVESINFAWKYKKLWVLGFIISLTGAGYTTNSNFNYNYSGIGEDTTNEFDEFIEELFTNPLGVLTLAFFAVVFFFVWIIGWYLLSVAKGALVNSVVLDKKGKKPNLKACWKFGMKYAFKYILIDISSFLISLMVFLPLIVLIALGVLLSVTGAGIIFLCLACIIVPFYIAYFIFWVMVYTTAQRLVVLDKLGPLESLRQGYRLAKDNVVNFILGWLVHLIPSCAWGLISCLILLIPAVTVSIIALAAFATGDPVVILILSMPAFLFVWVMSAIVNSPFAVFSHTYWTKLIMEMKKQ
jgi:hypothetical protein